MNHKSSASLLALLLCGGLPAAGQRADFDHFPEGDLAWATPGTTDKDFLAMDGWSDSAGESPGVIVAESNSGEYRGGRALRGSGSNEEYIGANPFLMPFDDVTGGVVFDALAGPNHPVTVAHWSDLDRDDKYDRTESRMQAGIVSTGSAPAFGLQGAGFAAVASSGVAPVTGNWYRIVVIHGEPDPSGKREIRMSAYNLTTSSPVDFDAAAPGVQAFKLGVEPAFYGSGRVDGVALRVTGEAAAIDQIGPLNHAKDGDNLLPLNTQRCWTARVVPGPADLAWVDTGMSLSYRNSPLGGSMEVMGFKAAGNKQTLRVAATAGAVLSIGAAGLEVQGPVGALQFGCDILLTADQAWHVEPVSQFIPGIQFYATSDFTTPTLDLGGRTVTKTGPEDLWITGGYDVLNGSIICREGTLAIASGGNSGDLKLPSSVRLRAENNGVISISNIGAGVTASPAIELDDGTLNIGMSFVAAPLTLGGPLAVGGSSKLVYSNANASSPSAVRYSLTGPLSGNGTLQVEATSPRPHADRLRFEGDNSAFNGRILVRADSGNRTLQLRTANAGSAAAVWEIAEENTLEVFGVQVHLGTLQGAGTIINAHTANAARISVGGGDFKGRILDGTQPMGLSKTGAGTLILSGENAYTGDTELLAGRLSLSRPTLADGAAVTLHTGATLALDFPNSDRIGELLIDGARQAAGTWGAPDSNAQHRTPLLSGSGLLLVTNGAAADPFAEWMAGYPAISRPADQARSADPDGDGVDNVLEWVLGGNPAAPDAGTVIGLRHDEGVTVEFTRAEASLGQGSLTLEWSTGLSGAWNSIAIGEASSGPSPENVSVTILSEPSPDQVRVRIPAEITGNGRLFVRLKFTN